MWDTVGKVLSGALLAAVIATFVAIIGPWHIDRKSERPSPTADDQAYLGPDENAPREFLYLDNARTEAYLSQLTGGNETLRTISQKTNLTASAEVALGPVTGSAEAARENALEQTVTPTTTSNFYALVARLTKFNELTRLPDPDVSRFDDVTESGRASADGEVPVDEHTNADFAASWQRVKEGDIVRVHAAIRRPTFVRLYETLRQAPPDSRLGRQGAQLLKAIGDQPRLPLAIEVKLPATAGTAPVLRLVMPVQAANLGNEPSLFATRLTVVGKVIRRIDRGDSYRDLNFYSRFQPALTLTPAIVRGRLNTPIRRLREELLRYRTLTDPSAVVLPIAIYR
jgi:hypothetical protein